MNWQAINPDNDLFANSIKGSDLHVTCEELQHLR